MKVVALSFLLGATVIFLVCTWAQSQRCGADGSATCAPPPRRAWSARWPTGSRSPRCSSIRWASRSRTPRSSSARRTSSARVSAPSSGRTSCRRRWSRPSCATPQVAGRLGKWLSEPAHAERVAGGGLDGAARAGGDAARRGRAAGAGPDDRQAHRRTAVGTADRPGAGHAAGRGPPGGAAPAAGRPGVPVVAERRRRSSSGSSSATRRPGRRAGWTSWSATASTAS